MSSLLNAAELLALDTGSDPATEQTRLVTVTSTDPSPEDTAWRLALYLSQSGGATSPTAALTVQASPDGDEWFPMVKVDTDGTTSEEWTYTAVDVPKYMRIKLEPAGGTNPAVEARVALFCSNGFTATVTTPS